MYLDNTENDDNLSPLLKEYNDFCAHNEWNSLFQRIKNNASIKMSDSECKVARSGVNRFKNTYREVVPYDFNRVILSRPFKSDTDYINASTIRCSGHSYIATQYPDKRTGYQFWSMVWQSQTPAIIMLGKSPHDETGIYYPTFNHEIVVCDPDNVEVKLYIIYSVNEVSHDGFIERKLRMDNVEMNDTVELMHFEFWSWPDQGVPQCMQSFLSLVAITRQYIIPDSASRPPIVHCSAGAGRTGTFCLVDTAISIAEKDGCLDNVNIQELMEDLRCQRMGMIRSFAQLKFCYEAVIEAFRRYRSSIGTKLGGSYLLSTEECHSCVNTAVKGHSSTCSEDGDSDVVMYIALSDDSDDASNNDDSSLDLHQQHSEDESVHGECNDGDQYRWHHQQVVSARKTRNQEKVTRLRRHLEDSGLCRQRLISTLTAGSVTLLEELNSDHYKSVVVAAAAVLCMGTFFWLKFSSSKCS